MPHEVKLNEIPAGYALETAQDGQPVSVAVREFTSSEDGELFISRLEGLPQQLLSLVSPVAVLQASTIDHLVAVIRKDHSATVYVNECKVLTHVRVKRKIDKGEYVSEDDIADINRLTFEGVEVPPDAGVVCVFSSGWRKGFFFDVAPLDAEGSDREYDIEELLGSYMAYLGNQRLFSLDDGDWSFLIERGWFPFIGLPKRVNETLIDLAKSRADIDAALPQVVEAVEAAVPMFRDGWSGSEPLRPHLEFLIRALDRFAERDFISCASILYTRIEGILRANHEALGEKGSANKQDVLARMATEAREGELLPTSWLLPDPFRRFIRESYFADFTPGQPAAFSRNSVGHGIATPEQFNEKAACIGLLMVDQLLFFLPAVSATE